uniref:Laminin G domain-containing protein n=1 Tax=Sinocyclocheilus grahami TaxID=75366 RepID=A0A672NDE8_SINGR
LTFDYRDIYNVINYCTSIIHIEDYDFKISLRTYDPEGVIFFAGGHLNSSWIVLVMHHGKLELQLKYGAVSRVTSSGPQVNDGQWHKHCGSPLFYASDSLGESSVN